MNSKLSRSALVRVPIVIDTRLLVSTILIVTFACVIVARATDVQPIDADILLRQATIHRGDGEAAVTGDVAVLGNRIVAVRARFR